MKKIKAYSYVRMSTEVQLKGNSLQRQLDLSEKYAAAHNLELVTTDIFHDLGVSAFRSTNRTHGELKRFLDAINSGRIQPGSVLLVESLDRLSRDQANVALRLFLAITEAGIKIVTLIDQQEYVDPVDSMKLIYSILVMTRAHEESMAKSHRISAAWNAKRQALDVSEKKLTKMCPHWLRLSDDRKEFIPIPERVKTVVEIFNDTINGLGVGLIAKRLNERNIPCWGRTQGWRDSYIKKLLSNRAVLGEFTPHTITNGNRTPLETKEGYYPAIISDDIFYRAEKARLSRRGAGGRKGKQIANLFAGTARCGYCGSPAHMKDGGLKNGKYLVCDKGRRGLGCHTNGFPYDLIEKTFLEVVPEIDLVEVFTGEDQQNDLRKLQAQIAEKEAAITSAKAATVRIADAIEQSGQALTTLVERLSKLEQQISELSTELAYLQDEFNTASTKTFNAVEYQTEVKLLASKLDQLRDDARLVARAKIQQRIRTLIDQIDLYPIGRVTDDYLKRMKKFLIDHGETKQPVIKRLLAAAQATGKTRMYFIRFHSKRYIVVHPDRTNSNEPLYVWDTDVNKF